MKQLSDYDAHQRGHHRRAPLDKCPECIFDELLEALRLCAEWMPKAEVRSWPPGFRLRDEALAKARAAIAKAEGREP